MPLEKRPNKMMQIEVRPQTVEKEDLSILVALPKHEVTQTLDTASAYKEVERRVVGCVHVPFQSVDGDGFGIREL